MSYEATCPKGHRLQVTELHFGKRVDCPTCGESFVVPSPGETAPLVQDVRGAGSRVLLGKINLSGMSLVAGRRMLALGLLLVLFTRGCDVIGNRGVDRLRQKAELITAQFADNWDQRRMDIDKKLKAIQEKESPTPEDSKLRDDLNKSLTDLLKDRRKAEETFQTTTLHDYTLAARDAAASNRIWAYWREIFFVLSTIILAMGLLVASWTAEGAERWVYLVMLAIIMFSVYIGGVAWIGGFGGSPIPG